MFARILRGLVEMRLLATIAVLCVSAVLGTSAYGLDVKPAGKAAKGFGPVIKLLPPSADSGKIGAGFGISIGGSEGAGTGTEIRIPGIGKLGVLPKLDFGLELLYGAGRPMLKEEDAVPDDLIIRGSVKKRF